MAHLDLNGFYMHENITQTHGYDKSISIDLKKQSLVIFIQKMMMVRYSI